MEGAGAVAEALATFFTFSDAGYFLGTVALINSLRLSGNRGEVVVVDGGLTGAQRTELGEVATVADLPRAVEGSHPLALKPSIYLLEPKGVVVLVDSDMIVTRPVDDLVERAESGRLVVFPDHVSMHERRFPEWEDLFELTKLLRRQQYVNAGFFALSVDRWPGFLERWHRATRRIAADRIQGDPRDPVWAADQDALNAILMSEIAPDDVWIGPDWESIHPDGLREVQIVDPVTLACTFRGKRTAVLHFSLHPKPWHRRAWRRIASHDAYVSLMPRVLLGPDVPLRAPPEQLPIWARPNRAARVFSATLRRVVSAGYGIKSWGLKARDAVRGA